MPLLFKIGDNIMAKACTHCNSTPDVPFAVLEANEARHERREKRLWLALIIAIVMIFISNAGWLWAWTSYDYVSEETIYTQDGQGTNIIGDSNEVDNGAETDNPQTEKNS
jgi:hypothetical protein